MTQRKIQEVVKTVAEAQLRNRVRAFEFEELFNVAMAAVLEAKKRHSVLNEKTVAVIAKRHIFRWKIKNTDPRSLPEGSTPYLYKQGRVEIPAPVPDFLSEDLVHWRRNERIRDLSLVVEKVYLNVGVLERRLMRTLMEGDSQRSLVKEFRKIHFPLGSGQKRLTIALGTLREQFQENGYRRQWTKS